MVNPTSASPWDRDWTTPSNVTNIWAAPELFPNTIPTPFPVSKPPSELTTPVIVTPPSKNTSKKTAPPPSEITTPIVVTPPSKNAASEATTPSSEASTPTKHAPFIGKPPTPEMLKNALHHKVIEAIATTQAPTSGSINNSDQLGCTAPNAQLTNPVQSALRTNAFVSQKNLSLKTVKLLSISVEIANARRDNRVPEYDERVSRWWTTLNDIYFAQENFAHLAVTENGLQIGYSQKRDEILAGIRDFEDSKGKTTYEGLSDILLMEQLEKHTPIPGLRLLLSSSTFLKHYTTSTPFNAKSRCLKIWVGYKGEPQQCVKVGQIIVSQEKQPGKIFHVCLSEYLARPSDAPPAFLRLSKNPSSSSERTSPTRDLQDPLAAEFSELPNSGDTPIIVVKCPAKEPILIYPQA